MYERKLGNRLSACLKIAKEELKEFEYGYKSTSEETRVHIYELEQGPILGEDDKSVEEEERPDGRLKEWFESEELKHR